MKLIKIIKICFSSLIVILFVACGGEKSSTEQPETPAGTSTPPVQLQSTIPEAEENNMTSGSQQDLEPSASQRYPLHRNITATLFWVGETESEANHQITNSVSAWDDHWMAHYGGVDTPDRQTLFPPFTPHENPFYFALPYNDFDDFGNRRDDVLTVIPWAKERFWEANESMVKNRWIEIVHNGKKVYAQWEDAGPFVYDDAAYVFGDATPANRFNDRAGLDLSPAVWIYLGYDTRREDNRAKVDWRFVNEEEVPEGPWRSIVTTRQIDWE